MTTVIVPFSGNANYQLEINITAGTPDPTTGDILVTHSHGIRQIGGANVSGTGTRAWGNGFMGEDGVAFSYNFTGYDYLEFGSSSYTSPRRFNDGSELEGYPAVYNTVTVTTSSLGTASGTAHAVPPGTPNATIPTLSPVSVVAGQPLTIGLPAENPSYIHDISYSIGWNQSPKQPIVSGVVGSSYVWQVPLSLRSNGMNFKIWVATYNGATKLGDRLVYGNLLLPTGEEPSVTGFSSIDDNPNVVTKVGKYVQSLSTLRLTDITATAKNGASIADSWLSIEGVNIKTGETRALISGGSVPVTAIARDSRGVQGALNTTVDVLPYSSPSLTVPSTSPTGSNAYRSTSSGVYDADGLYLAVTYTASVASLVNSTERNTLTVRVSTREFDGTTWTVRNTITPATTLVSGRRTTADLTAVVGGGAIYSADTSYVVRIEVIDQFNTLVREDTVSTAFVTIDLNGQNVGVAKLHERGTLDVGGDGYFFGVGSYLPAPNANSGTAFLRPRSLEMTRSNVTQIVVSGDEVARGIPGYGTNADRIALASSRLIDGFRFYETDTGLEWIYKGGTWFVLPGQVLASMVGPVPNAGGTGVIIGTIISTPVLPVGQPLKIMSNFSQFETGTGISTVRTNWRNNAANVSYTTYDGSVVSRAYDPAGSIVTSGRGCSALYTTTANAKVSAAIYTDTSGSQIYGTDGTHLWIETA